jgi:hypothetical protein
MKDSSTGTKRKIGIGDRLVYCFNMRHFHLLRADKTLTVFDVDLHAIRCDLLGTRDEKEEQIKAIATLLAADQGHNVRNLMWAPDKTEYEIIN